jgi:DNA-binding response OmpR family regulator
MTHRELLREVWGPSHSESSHYLRVYMGHLRHKLEVDPAQPAHLLTEVGVGYRFAGAEIISTMNNKILIIKSHQFHRNRPLH